MGVKGEGERSQVEAGSVNRFFKTPVIFANTGYGKGLSRKLGCGKIAALFLHITTGLGIRPASSPDFSASRFFRKFSDLDTPIYRAPLYIDRWPTVIHNGGRSPCDIPAPVGQLY